MTKQKRTYEQRKMTELTKGMGIGKGARNTVQNQKKRNGKDRDHGDLTLDQAYDITAELLIRQNGKCWITGTDLLINGYAEDVRSYSIDRLDDTKGYSVENCRAVCVWANLATGCLSKPHQKLGLWRYLTYLPPYPKDETSTEEAPNFAGFFTSRSCMGFAITGDFKKATRVRANTWLTYFDLPKIIPFYQMDDQEVLGLLGCEGN